MSGPFGSSQWMYSSGFYDHEISNSLRFNNDDSAALGRTPGSAGNRDVWTWSCWVKLASLQNQYLLSAYAAANDAGFFGITFRDTGSIRIQGWNTIYRETNALFRDFSSWYHIVVAVDTTDGTADDRIKLYVNGSQITDFATNNAYTQNDDTQINNTSQHYIGRFHSGEYLDGYMAEANFIDGSQLTPASFGKTKSNIWIPKDTSGLTFGTNGFRMEFLQTALSNDANGVGADTSGNNHHFAVSNFHTTDNVLDSPTNNFPVMSFGHPSSGNFTISEGNLKATKVGTGTFGLYSQSIMPLTGKWYFEVCITGRGTSDRTRVGIANYHSVTGTSTIQSSYSGVEVATSMSRLLITEETSVTEVDGFYTALSDDDIVRFAVDMDNGKLYVGVNGNWWNYNSSETGGNPASGNGYVTNSTTIFNGSPMTAYSGFSAGATTSSGQVFNFGQDSGFAGAVTAQGNTDGNGEGDFYYAPPSGFLAICTANLPDPAIDPSKGDTPDRYFNTVLWTGNGSDGRSITGVGFDPDFVWIKSRNLTTSHLLNDTVRGANKSIFSEAATAETPNNGGGYLSAFVSDGFSVTSGSSGDDAVNDGSDTYASWNWLAGTAFSNDASSTSVGTIDSEGQINTKAGFAIIKHTGTGSAGTLAHGLSQAPDTIWLKSRSDGEGWVSFWNTPGMGPTKFMGFNSTGAAADSDGEWNDTAPTSSLFTIGTQGRVNTNTKDYIAYLFHNIEGYSKVGSYAGNGNADGPFIFTGHRPSWVLIKRTDGAGTNWWIFDNKRSTFNVVNDGIIANGSDAEFANNSSLLIDFLSNGFKIRNTYADLNTNGADHVFIAFAEQPLKYSNAR